MARCPDFSPTDYTLYANHGFVYLQRQAALNAAGDPNNPWYTRAGMLVLGTAATPLAWAEEYIGRATANIPFTVDNVSTVMAENMGCAVILLEDGQTSKAVPYLLSATAHGAEGFVIVGSVLMPVEGAVSQAGKSNSIVAVVPKQSATEFTLLKPGQPLPDNLEIVVTGSNNKPGNFILRPGVDNKPLGSVTTPGKSATIATDLTLETEFSKMFGRAPKRGDTLSGSFVEDVRAAGFDVIYAPTANNPNHVRIVPNINTFDETGRGLLSQAFDVIARQRK